MPSTAHHADAVDGQAVHGQHRLGAAVAAGFQNPQGIDIGHGQQLRLDGAVHIQTGAGGAVLIVARRQRADLLPELRDILSVDGKACRKLVAAVAFQQGGQSRQGGKEVESAVAAGAGLAVLTVQTDQEGGTGVFLGNAAGNDANHALMPAFVRQHNGLRGLPGGQHGHGLLVDLRFHSLPLAVQGAQRLGNFRSPFGVIGQKQFQRQIDLPHPPGGIDPGGQHEADGGRIDSFGVTAALFHQRGNARTVGVGQLFQPPGSKHPVLTPQRHHVRDGSQTYHVGVLGKHLFLIAAQGGSQLEGDAHAGKIFVGVAAVVAVGVHHGNGLGQGILALMVVGDHQIHSQLPAQLRFGDGGDAAVHGDDELHAVLMELVQGDGVQTVALFQPAGDVADAVGTVAAQKVRQQTGGGDAVHVIVAKNGNFLLVFDGHGHPARGFVHIRHQKRVRKSSATVQNFLRLLAGFDAPGGQHHGRQRGVSSPNQRIDSSHIRLPYIPNSVFHLSTHPVISIFLIL